MNGGGSGAELHGTLGGKGTGNATSGAFEAVAGGTLAGGALWALSPAPVWLCLVCALCVGIVVGYVISWRKTVAKARANDEYRLMIEAETQAKLDAAKASGAFDRFDKK
ncbi:hypothetical protein [Jannaschia marina]|uniref:hypothetical protein n=1 Tax=Jannaschia marina TaxID=2741674 RepID=UPI0015CECD2C|nr:hypothetical protein [Jannaschia marina]